MRPLRTVVVFQAASDGRRVDPEEIRLCRRCAARDKHGQAGQLHKDRAGIRPLRQKRNLRWCRDLPKRFLTVRENDAVLCPLVAASTTALHNDRAIVDVICVVRVLRRSGANICGFYLIICAWGMMFCTFASWQKCWNAAVAHAARSC